MAEETTAIPEAGGYINAPQAPIEAKKKIPAFLKVLCILTFVGSAIGIIQGATDGESSKLGLGWVSWVSVLASILTAVGAFLMLKLRKTGFPIYAIGELIPSVLAFGFVKPATDKILENGGAEALVAMTGNEDAMQAIETLGSDATSMLQIIFTVVNTLSLLMAVAFVVMYAMNLKHMK